MTTGRLRVVGQEELAGELGQAIREALCICFPADRAIFSKTLAWHGSAPAWGVIIEEYGRVVAHVGVVDRTLMAADEQVRVAGIQNVFVIPEHRGKGLGQQVMIRAMQEAGRLRFDGGLLFCIPAIAKVYTPCGWQVIEPSSVTRIDENGAALPLPEKNIAMYYPLERKGFPAGSIHLQGNDW